MHDPAVEKAHTHSIRNEAEVRASTECGCFSCVSIFPTEAIVEWIAESPKHRARRRTALCPRCGIDSVIGSASGYPIERAFLERMQAHFGAMGEPGAGAD